ncbi:MAG: hypothetical protein M3Z14_00195 [Candidatus Eremiobacteraeota bacterium]|nr:hypothetical protein [Candidatus Eremiobacteraeota bacterium]
MLTLLSSGCAARHSNVLAASSTDLRLPSGFALTVIAHVDGARELTVSPNGDVFVGTKGTQIFVIPSAEDGGLRSGHAFTTIDDAPVAGVTLTKDAMYAGSQFGVWRVPYKIGDRTARAKPKKIASVRTSGVSSDHVTTSIAYSHNSVFASVGSSCNVCDPESDATRATIAQIAPDDGRMDQKAIHIRNAIALTTNPNTGTVWAGVAGQDELQHGHPYEIFDAVTLHSGVADYGWPYCYDKRRPAKPGRNCANVVVPRVVFPAYETPMGAAIYPAHPRGKHAFPSTYWGGAFVALHGSWHQPPVPPRVAFIPLRGDVPAKPVNWSNPGAQWSEFVGGYQNESGGRGGRPTGVAVGPAGDLFVADDFNGNIYRIRAVR